MQVKKAERYCQWTAVAASRSTLLQVGREMCCCLSAPSAFAVAGGRAQWHPSHCWMGQIGMRSLHHRREEYFETAIQAVLDHRIV